MRSVLDVNYRPYLPQSKDARILDLGCGTGRLLEYLSNLGYQNVLGVDVDPSALAGVPTSVRGKTQLITDVHAFLTSHEQSFELIIAKDVIYYLPRESARQAMTELAAALRPNGAVIVEVFNGALWSAPYTAAKDVGILTMYTEHSLRGLLESGGLHVEAVFGQKTPSPRTLRALAYRALTTAHAIQLHAVFVAERGLDPANPTIFTKSILGIGRKSAP